MEDEIINKLARYLHKVWCDSKKQDGYHSPEKCPTIEIKNNEDELKDIDIIHCNKCVVNIKEFDKLDSINQKKYMDEAKKMLDELEKNGLTIVSK